MVVQHNLVAMNSNRMLGLTTKTVSSSTEKLSSGYRINRAADDAAGLAISEKMRQQVRGLTQASANAEDGISCVQTAEGALAEVQDMLQRMNELCVQAANGTQSTTDRQYVQDEIDQLCSEIDRIAETTKFNETFLLKGDQTGKTTAVYMTDYSVTYTKNITSNAVSDASKYNIKYNGNSNIYMVSASIYETASSIALSAEPIGNNGNITDYFKDAGAAAGADTISVTDGNFSYDTKFDQDKYVAFVNVELYSKISTSNQPNQVDATSGRAFDLYIDSTSSVVRASQDLYIYNTDTETITHFSAGEDVSAYLNDDNTMRDEYRLVDILSGDKTKIKDHAGNLVNNTASERVNTEMTLNNNGFDWSKKLELDKTKQTLYDANGTIVSGIALNKYFNENGTYTGGLYTTSQARMIDEVFGSKNASGYAQVSNILGTPAATIGAYISQSSQKIASELSFNIHVGAQSDRSNKITAKIETLTAAGLGIDKLSSKGIGIVDGTGDNATDAVDVVASALTQLSRQRSELGAVQNRLEHTVKNLDNIVENTTAAESQIRDTDMATEMVKNANSNILQQAGQAMLAQANQSNEGILSLLQ